MPSNAIVSTRPDLRAFMPLALLCALFLLLQGCMMAYFFAPKLAAGELPSDPQIEPLRSAYITHCGRCHLLVAPRYYDRDHPIDRYADRYVSRRILTQREADDAAAYIRVLAANLGPAASPVPTATPDPALPWITPPGEGDQEPDEGPDEGPNPVVTAPPAPADATPEPIPTAPPVSP